MTEEQKIHWIPTGQPRVYVPRWETQSPQHDLIQRELTSGA